MALPPKFSPSHVAQGLGVAASWGANRPELTPDTGWAKFQQEFPSLARHASGPQWRQGFTTARRIGKVA